MSMSKTATYKTKLSVEECISRVKSHSMKAKLFSLRGYPAGTVVYSLKRNSFKLKATLGEYMSNSFEPIFYGTFEPVQDGTLIRGKFAMHKSVRVFMAFWFAFGIAFFGVTVWAAFIAPATGYETVDRVPYWAPLFPAVVVIFGYLIVRYGQRLGDSQRAAVLEFLSTTLEAVEQQQCAEKIQPVRPIE